MSYTFPSHAGTGVTVAGHDSIVVTDEGKRVVADGYASDGNFYAGDGRLPGLMIRWQDGPVDRENGQAPNGCFVEDVIEVCKRRLQTYQQSDFACEENAAAISHLESALGVLLDRRKGRRERGVEGKNEV